ncbi:MAG: nucleotidyltransferase family protein [bacterium]
MRLSAEEAKIIKNLAVKYFGANSNIYLFGSRADDKKRGGDIDLYIEIDKLPPDIFDSKINFIVD